jgi:hypothetical protein
MTNKEAALQYAAWGLPVLPCHWIEGGVCSCGQPCKPAGKHPLGHLVPRGLHQASTDELVVGAWWDQEPRANIAIRTGNGYAVLDIDPRHGGDETLRQWEQTHGVLPEGMTAFTGGGGWHRWFVIPPGVTIPSRANVLGPGVDVRAEGGYVMAPPSNHLSGCDYAWDVDHHPEEGVAPAAMPPALLAALQVREERPAPAVSAERLSPEKVTEIRSALACIPPTDDRDLWYEIGMALHSTRAENQAYGLWVEWSQGSDKYNAKDQLRVWRSFKPDRGKTISTLFRRAKDEGWVDPGGWTAPENYEAAPQPMIEVGEELVPPEKPAPLTAPPPSNLTQLSGVLGEFVDYYHETSQQTQPAFAVQAGLALGSVCLGRMWATDRNQWPTLYLICVGDSCCGKEHVKKSVERVLHEAGLARDLLGGSGYTSEGAAFSALRDRPCHITIMDEIGIILEANKDSRNHNAHAVRRVLMEAIGRCDSPMISQVYSSVGLTAEQREKLRHEPIQNPALTLVGMTTPSTFYRALNSSALEDGFMGRLVIVQTHLPLSAGCDPKIGVPIPQRLLEWCKHVRRPVGNIPVQNVYSVPSTPRLVPYSGDAYAYSQVYAAEMVEWRNRLTASGSGKGVLLGRTREMAQRIALILAVAQDSVSPMVKLADMEWAADYTRFYAQQTLNACETHMVDSRWDGIRRDITNGLNAAGEQGVSGSEMCQKPPFKSIAPQERKTALKEMLDNGLAVRVLLNVGGRGRPGERWYAAWAAPGQTPEPAAA